jgi:hypothetical protein
MPKEHGSGASPKRTHKLAHTLHANPNSLILQRVASQDAALAVQNWPHKRDQEDVLRLR